jgi:predicted nucleotidyltransferase
VIKAKIEIPQEKIMDFCRRWRIVEFALFGSVLRNDFRPDSGIDILITFDPNASWTLFDLVEMQDELRGIFGREIDLISKRGLENSQNYIRKKEILKTAENILAIHE